MHDTMELGGERIDLSGISLDTLSELDGSVIGEELRRLTACGTGITAGFGSHI
jgi:hypothetical protein